MKSLSERIAERANGKRSCIPNYNRAVVLALRQDIQQARADGWSVLAIYQTLFDEGRVTFSYQAFRRHVSRLLTGQPEPSGTAGKKPRVVTELPANGRPNFHFNPVPNKRELL